MPLFQALNVPLTFVSHLSQDLGCASIGGVLSEKPALGYSGTHIHYWVGHSVRMTSRQQVFLKRGLHFPVVPDGNTGRFRRPLIANAMDQRHVPHEGA